MAVLGIKSEAQNLAWSDETEHWIYVLFLKEHIKSTNSAFSFVASQLTVLYVQAYLISFIK